ncbi:MAG: hypothetical protein ABIZ70_08680 [Gemmatimonadales bacterium]
MSFRSLLLKVLILPWLAGCQNIFTLPDDGPLPRPATLTTTSLDGGVALHWSDEPFRASPGRFRLYRVYSSPYDLDRDLCLTPWSVEGTTVANDFVAGALTNGAPRCFSVTAESVEGFESDRSPTREDTPRFESTSVAVYARQSDDTRAGFRFWRDLDGNGGAVRSELGWVMSGAADVDLVVQRDAGGRFTLVPQRAGTEIAVYGQAPVGSLHDIDVAPLTGFARTGVEAIAGWGYVVQMTGADGFKRFGALRVVSVGAGFLLLDWAFQNDPGNPELIRVNWE